MTEQKKTEIYGKNWKLLLTKFCSINYNDTESQNEGIKSAI